MARARDRVRYWDDQAATYDTRTAGMERRLLAVSRAWVAERVHGTTLELGVGTGANLAHYAPDLDLVAVDWSEEMLARARHRATAIGSRVAFRRADAGALPFAASSFDTVVSTFAMCCVPDLERTLGEALRVLRPGGRLLLADHVVASFWPLRLVQHAADLVSVPRHGEHFTRRPSLALRRRNVEIIESERTTLGAIERVHARAAGVADR
ncbi:MAG: class I SAM-dependent methyltransferase [Nocardioidaceae bacterium]|nr:class I SAM-dependent methyltransferase [Nocardioidaceae bacterium]